MAPRLPCDSSEHHDSSAVAPSRTLQSGLQGRSLTGPTLFAFLERETARRRCRSRRRSNLPHPNSGRRGAMPLAPGFEFGRGGLPIDRSRFDSRFNCLPLLVQRLSTCCEGRTLLRSHRLQFRLHRRTVLASNCWIDCGSARTRMGCLRLTRARRYHARQPALGRPQNCHRSALPPEFVPHRPTA